MSAYSYKILKQEGWHFHLEKPEDELTYNGVVYNEMKGVYSSADSQLAQAVQQALYPDTTYGFDSGGDPKNIPELSYEEFLNFHRKYYQIPNDERLLIIPKNIGSKVSIYEVMYKNDELIETKILLESQFIEDKQVFDLKFMIPEGIPQMKIVIKYKENQAEYLVTYDGMGSRSQIEYLEYKD